VERPLTERATCLRKVFANILVFFYATLSNYKPFQPADTTVAESNKMWTIERKMTAVRFMVIKNQGKLLCQQLRQY